ncbi:MAG: 16S rRNA (cytosine(1402)-N(4))-methyltransferase RsmH [Phycisphaerales bacterium]|nr:16S rRNA (cytosine(1402)-N(4))-methyltransferase RsmH [Phycisphaerales bacterium]
MAYESDGHDSTSGHLPVLRQATVDFLAAGSPRVLADLTAGRGGHAEALAQAMGEGTLVLCDLDPGNLQAAGDRVEAVADGPSVRRVAGSFTRVPRLLKEEGLAADAVLADLGFASNQVDDPERGFSFMRDGPLDMRLDPESPLSAARLLATASEPELARIIREFGEEPLARRIARKLVQEREKTPIERTADLARLVREAYGSRAHSSRLHPATRTFQALRIAVNDELGALDGLLRQVLRGAESVVEDRPDWLAPGSRIAIITFHSLEDRRVKQAFAELERRGLGQRSARKPIIADEAEIAENPRARSAKLRIATVGDPTGD